MTPDRLKSEDVERRSNFDQFVLGRSLGRLLLRGASRLPGPARRTLRYIEPPNVVTRMNGIDIMNRMLQK